MPDLFPSIHVVGELLPEAAEKLNLIKGIPVVLGGHDVPCTAVGAGNVTSGRVSIIILVLLHGFLWHLKNLYLAKE